MTQAGNARGSAGELEDIACALCGGRETAPELVASDLRRGVPGSYCVVRCRRCGLCYVNPRPTRSAIARCYPPDYKPHRAGPPAPLEALYYRAFRALPLRPTARVLDVGCGGGRYLLALRERGYRVCGVEPNAALATQLRERHALEVQGGDLEHAHFEPGSFDAVCFWWVLEHTHDPLAILRRARELLRPSGWCIVSLQNFSSLARQLFGASWHHLDVPGHLYHFDPESLGSALRSSGFELARLRQDLLALDFAASLALRFGQPRAGRGLLASLASLPFDLLAWSLRRSGLITAYARRGPA